MTPEEQAAHVAADREAEEVIRAQDEFCAGLFIPAEPYCSCAPTDYPLCAACAAFAKLISDLYVRAFLAGVQWQQQQLDPLIQDWLRRYPGRSMEGDGVYQDCAEELAAFLKNPTGWRAKTADEDTPGDVEG